MPKAPPMTWREPLALWKERGEKERKERREREGQRNNHSSLMLKHPKTAQREGTFNIHVHCTYMYMCSVVLLCL